MQPVFLLTVESFVTAAAAADQYESVQTTPVGRIGKKRTGEYHCPSSERRKRRRFLQTLEFTATTQDSPDVAVSSPFASCLSP
jgi:hypothetical protein